MECSAGHGAVAGVQGQLLNGEQIQLHDISVQYCSRRVQVVSSSCAYNLRPGARMDYSKFAVLRCDGQV